MSGRVSMTVPQYRRGECTIGNFRQRLDPQETEVLALLLTNHPECFLPMPALIDGLWSDDEEEPLNADVIVRVRICALRRFGVHIINAKCFGYRIPAFARHEGLPLLEQRMVA